MQRNLLQIITITMLLLSCGEPVDPDSLSGSGQAGHRVVATLELAGYAQDVLVEENIAYVAEGEGGISIIDVSDPSQPAILNNVFDDLRGYSAKLAKKDSALYVAAGSFGVTVVNVANPFTAQVTVSNLNMKPARNFAIHEDGGIDYLITAISEQGVKVAEIDFPVFPDIRGSNQAPGYARGLYLDEAKKRLYIANGEVGLAVLDLSDFDFGFGDYPLLGWVSTPGYAEDVVVDTTSNTAYLACGTSGLQIVDVSDPENMEILGAKDAGGYSKEILRKDHTVYMASESQGVQIIDVSNASAPSVKGAISTNQARGVYLTSSHLFIADEEDGLVIVALP